LIGGIMKRNEAWDFETLIIVRSNNESNNKVKG
jgi:hypothetical protein